eukprot:3103903-Ditylum_brightwellii.AAC.1
MEKFKLRYETTASGYITMVMYMTITHTVGWRALKMHYAVIHQLQKQDCYMYIDQFDIVKVGMPRFLTKIYPQDDQPKMTCRNNGNCPARSAMQQQTGGWGVEKGTPRCRR